MSEAAVAYLPLAEPAVCGAPSPFGLLAPCRETGPHDLHIHLSHTPAEWLREREQVLGAHIWACRDGCDDSAGPGCPEGERLVELAAQAAQAVSDAKRWGGRP